MPDLLLGKARLLATAQAWPGEDGKPASPLAPRPSSPACTCGVQRTPFSPELSVFPLDRRASTPSGVDVEVKIPQATTLAANGVAEADVKETELVFPEGLQANAGAADGLQACQVRNIGFEGLNTGESKEQLEATIARQRFTPGAAECPGASEIGELEVHTPAARTQPRRQRLLRLPGHQSPSVRRWSSTSSPKTPSPGSA